MFRLVSIAQRAALEVDGLYYDLADVSRDPSLSDPMVAIARHHELGELSLRCGQEGPSALTIVEKLDAPVPRPQQIFAIGLNYAKHATESAMALPPAPLTFTKFPSSLSGPTDDIPLTSDKVDWEVEIVAVIGERCSHVALERAWDAVAGLTLGQDVSDRLVQMTGTPPQFSLGKSFTGFSPIGPALVSTDSFANRDDIALWCDVSGERMQDASTKGMIFSIPQLVAYLSSICELFPGDLIFTGTPDGVGAARGRFLSPGDVVRSHAEGIGYLVNSCVPGRGPLRF